MFRATKLIKQHYWHLANSSWLKNSINVSTTYSIEDEEWNKSERIEAKTCYDVRRHFTFQCGDHLHSNYTMDRNCTSKEKILVYRRASIRYQCTVIIDSNNCRQFQKWPPSANKLIPIQCRDVQISLLIPESADSVRESATQVPYKSGYDKYIIWLNISNFDHHHEGLYHVRLQTIDPDSRTLYQHRLILALDSNNFTDSATTKTAVTTSVDGIEASATDQSFSIDSECSNFNCHESIFSYFDLSQFVCILIGLFAIAFTSIFLLFFCLVERNRCRTITFASQ